MEVLDNEQPTSMRIQTKISAIALLLMSEPGLSQTISPPLNDGRMGYVISHIEYALSEDAANTGACPNGMSLNAVEIFQLTPQGKQQRGESDMAYQQRLSGLQRGTHPLVNTPEGKNHCMHPELAGPDPHFRHVESSAIPVAGIPLNGSSTFGSDPAWRFPILNGKDRVENQFFRAVGCTRSWQSGGASNGFATEMRAGSWGIVIALEGVDDLHNDDAVTVGIHANADPIMLSPNREPLPYATYTPKDDPRYRATTQGKIVDGVLTTEPVDVRFGQVVNSMMLDRPMRDARLKVTLSPEGQMEGYLAGYTPVEDLYNYQFGYRNAIDPAGGPSPLQRRIGSASGSATSSGRTCNGIYHALRDLADGHPDPESGRFTSISTQYRIEGVPAFVVDLYSDHSQQRATQQTAGSK